MAYESKDARNRSQVYKEGGKVNKEDTKPLYAKGEFAHEYPSVTDPKKRRTIEQKMAMKKYPERYKEHTVWDSDKKLYKKK